MTRFLLVLTLLPAFALAAEDDLPAQPLFVTHDLVFTVVNIGGEVRDIEVKETELEIKIDLAADVLFDFDKANIRPDAESALQKAAEIIRSRSRGKIAIVGHTDSKGDDAYNQKLSERRAASVKIWLAKNGKLGQREMITSGQGESEPAAPNANPDGSDNPEGRQQNRRVEITVRK